MRPRVGLCGRQRVLLYQDSLPTGKLAKNNLITSTATMSSSTSPIVPLWIDNKPVTTSTTFDVISPATGKALYQSSSAGVDEATAAVESAQRAFPQWSQASPAERRKIFLAVADMMDQRQEELARFAGEQTGQDHAFAMEMVTMSAEYMREIASRITSLEAFSPPLLDGKQRALVLKKPCGVILGIAPWYSSNTDG
jgi:acyl-CoA reductase-like NAD-dependent aldehyde dehydrogenase